MLDSEAFKTLVKNAPLVAVDFIITNSNNQVLLGKRVNSPAKGMWCVPGGRVRKGESLKEAVRRKLAEEVGLVDVPPLEFLGIYEHFYEDSYFCNETTTHYLAIAFKFEIQDLSAIKACSQHESFIFIDINEAIELSDIPVQIKHYLQGSFMEYLDINFN